MPAIFPGDTRAIRIAFGSARSCSSKRPWPPSFPIWPFSRPLSHALRSGRRRAKRSFALWEGLGYYRRARDLHRGAQWIADATAANYLRDEAAVHNLPGFGRYTTNAVLSQAFDAKLPILEANSVRSLCRLSATTDDAKSPATLKKLWQLSEELLPTKRRRFQPSPHGTWRRHLHAKATARVRNVPWPDCAKPRPKALPT